MKCFALIALVVSWGAPGRPTPAGELQLVLDDLAGIAPAARADVRYLSLYAVPPGERQAALAAVSFVLNSVSRADVVVRPDVVPHSEGRLLRIALSAYGVPAVAWEQLAADDPYWHLRTQVVDPAGGQLREVRTDGGWVDLQAAAALRQATQSTAALLRADFFIARAATTAAGGHYYRLAGIPPREADFLQLVGIERDTIDRLRADAGANLFRSQITFKPRRLVRRQGPLGGAWQTFDVVRGTAERDPFRNPFSFDFDASEHIAAKRNGLHLFALYDRRGQRQDKVADEVAKDTSDPHGAGIVTPLISCVRCHVEDGLRPFTNDQQRLLAGGVELLAERPSALQRLAAFYGTDLQRPLARDREDYAAAVALATDGWSVFEAARALAVVFSRYSDELVGPAEAAREVGVDVAQLGIRLRAATDPVLLALAEEIAVQRSQWEASFGTAALLCAEAE